MRRDLASPNRVPFRAALRVWMEIALNSFGGPAGQIAVMHRVLVERRRWISERRFLHALNYCMLLPGPEATQLATYVGWLLHGFRGGLAAGVLFVLPGFLSILALSFLYVRSSDVTLVAALLFGLKSAVLALVVAAVLRIGGRVLRTPLLIALAALAFVALFAFGLPFPAVVVAAGAIGLVGGRIAPAAFSGAPAHGSEADEDERDAGLVDAILRGRETDHEASWGRAARVLLTGLAVWLGPIAALWAFRGRGDVFVEQAIFFSKAAVFTFGGAYGVLAYIAQQAVEVHHWLRPGEMLDGLGMAETTPGPLIMVVQFVAFLGAYRADTGLDPSLAGLVASVITTWVTFVPSFLGIFLGAPWIEQLHADARLTSALSAISATVVGVIANLALWLSLHVLFGEVDTIPGPLGLRWIVPRWASVDVAACALAVAAFAALVGFRARVIPTLLGCAAAGAAYRLWLAPGS